MLHVNNFNDFVNEAFKPMNMEDFSKILYKHKDDILKIIKKGNPKFLISYLNKIFRNKLPQSEKSVLEINNNVNQIINEIKRIENKILKYPQLRPFLKQEIKEERAFIKFLKNKNKRYIKLIFFTYDNFHNLRKKNLIGRFFHKIRKFLTPNLFQYEYLNKDYHEEVRKHDLGVNSAFFEILTNSVGIILKEDVVKKLNEDNFDQFVLLLEGTLKHELTHMRDFLNRDVKEMRDNSGYVSYLEENTEIKAYAEGVVFDLKKQGFDNKEIEDILINPSKNKMKVKSSDSLKGYYNRYYFTNKMVYYRLISECLDILNEEYENERIK
jgi:hypothetical protein